MMFGTAVAAVVDSPVGRLRTSKPWLMWGALATAVTFESLLCVFFAPRWMTVDDVGVSMFAHGYGVAAMGSPNLLFSNVLWGCLVRAIPETNGVLGYSIATLGVLVIVGTVMLYGLFRLGVGYVGCLSALALILVRPVLFPQFTINAGLLLIGAITCWHLYAQQHDGRALLIGCILAYLSYLVRSVELCLVLIIALPLLPWRALCSRRFSRIAFLALGLMIAASAAIDHQAYQGDEWGAFNELNPVRAPFTDFGAGHCLKQRPDILERHGYSINDIDLITNWFFADSDVANPRALQAMLTELGPYPIQEGALMNGWVGVQTLWSPALLSWVLAALLLVVLRPSWQMAASWGLCISVVFVLGLLGRPGVLHVYVPLVCLLWVAPFLRGQVSVVRGRLCAGVLLVAAVVNAAHVCSESKTLQFAAEQTRKELAAFPSVPVVIWGTAFPYVEVYPVLGASPSAMSYRHYGLGVSMLAPFTFAYAEIKAGRSMVQLLAEEKGVSMMANPRYYRMLEIYCNERIRGQLKELSSRRYGAIEVSQRRCEVKP